MSFKVGDKVLIVPLKKEATIDDTFLDMYHADEVWWKKDQVAPIYSEIDPELVGKVAKSLFLMTRRVRDRLSEETAQYWKDEATKLIHMSREGK